MEDDTHSAQSNFLMLWLHTEGCLRSMQRAKGCKLYGDSTIEACCSASSMSPSAATKATYSSAIAAKTGVYVGTRT